MLLLLCGCVGDNNSLIVVWCVWGLNTVAIGPLLMEIEEFENTKNTMVVKTCLTHSTYNMKYSVGQMFLRSFVIRRVSKPSVCIDTGCQKVFTTHDILRVFNPLYLHQ